MIKFTLSPNVPNAQKPVFNAGSAGIDLITPVDIIFPEGYKYPLQFVVDTGVIVDLGEDTRHFIIYPRSSWAGLNLRIANTVGVIDHKYRGERDTLKVVVERTAATLRRVITVPDGIGVEHTKLPELVYKAGERFCQIVILNHVDDGFQYVPFDYWPHKTNRGGFGSTGK